MERRELLRLIEQAAAEQWEELDLSGKHLKELPPEIGQLRQLKRRKCQNSGLILLFSIMSRKFALSGTKN